MSSGLVLGRCGGETLFSVDNWGTALVHSWPVYRQGWRDVPEPARDPKAGDRLRRAIESSEGYPGTRQALSEAADISVQALGAWFAKGVPPTIPQLSKVAAAIRRPTIELYMAWFGVPVDGTREIAREIKLLRRALVPAGADEHDEDLAHGAVTVAQEGPTGEPAASPPREPDASVPRHRPAVRTRRR